MLPCVPYLQQKPDRRPDSGGSGSGGSKRDRCFGVDAYWRQLDPAQRRQLLRAPLSKMAEGTPCGTSLYLLANAYSQQLRGLSSLMPAHSSMPRDSLPSLPQPCGPSRARRACEN